MPLPLLWLGAAAASAITVGYLAEDRKRQQKKRYKSRVKKLSELHEQTPEVAIYPSWLLTTHQYTEPKVGAIVCCAIGGVLDHTGIWLGDNTIVELAGDGLVKAVSPQRFIANRSGQQIFVAADSHGQALASRAAAERAISQIYQYYDYHLIENNCHQFVWQCYQPGDKPLTSFSRLNHRLAQHFDRVLYWDKCLLE